jgi:hypothetical protein
MVLGVPTRHEILLRKYECSTRTAKKTGFDSHSYGIRDSLNSNEECFGSYDLYESAILGSTINGTSGTTRSNASSIDSTTIACA